MPSNSEAAQAGAQTSAELDSASWLYQGRQYQFRYEAGPNQAFLLTPRGEKLLDFPAGAKLSLDSGEIFFATPAVEVGETSLVVRSQHPGEALEEIRLRFTFHEDCIVVGLEADVAAGAEASLISAVYFQQGTHGLHMVDCLRAFCTTPAQEGFYEWFKPRCDAFSTLCPPPLNFAVGNPHGLVGFGLIDLPDSMVFGLTDEYSILAENTGGNKKIAAGATYTAPRLLLTFPDEEYQSLAIFREKLIQLGFHKPLLLADRNVPEWWRKPLVCTYGDEIMELQYNPYATEDWNHPGFNSHWLRQWIAEAEARLGLPDFTIIIDVFWQRRFSADPSPDPERFPDLRQIIDECHARGHKVLLWYGPFLDKLDLGFEPASKRFGVITDTPAGFDNVYTIDFTHPNAQAYLDFVAQRLFGRGEGELDADGLKMDFMCWVRDPKNAKYHSPEMGMGIRELYLFQEQMMAAAAKVKPGLLISTSTCDPRFERVVAMNRIHDTHYFWYEREIRARFSSLAAPLIPIDSDGAVMKSDWVEASYIDAVLYGTPSLYYVRVFQDGAALSDEKMRALGRLLSLSDKKPDGQPICNGYGNWQWLSGGRIMGETIGGHSLILFDVKGKAYIFTWKDGAQSLPLHGHILRNIQPSVEGLRVVPGAVTAHWEAGTLYECTVEQTA